MGYLKTVSNMHTFELRCWRLDGRFTLRETEAMKRDTRFYRRHCISTVSISHSDEMYQEMG
ncbi:unnamed protein product [Spirodela intermedia]|uniref:Uncharacterized protein n=1 Tax=Spirodela intermedia TaxID=51605 RepID=A0A7I8INX5_SPIIN|nr:unnamed protein product [Spirodela intermedia]CAA6658697.1 unnamed protein product [Spirodela intermedia]